MIVDHEQRVMEASQDDIILFDQYLAPAMLASTNSTHGVYFFDNVLGRVEVKSVLTKADLRLFVRKSKAVSELKLSARPGRDEPVFGAINTLAAFDTKVARGKGLDYLCETLRAEGRDPVGGVGSSMCIARRGFWLLGETDDGARRWKQLRASTPDDPLAHFVGVTSNTCFAQRAARLGIQPLGGGIGLYLDHPFDFVDP